MGRSIWSQGIIWTKKRFIIRLSVCFIGWDEQWNTYKPFVNVMDLERRIKFLSAKHGDLKTKSTEWRQQIDEVSKVPR